MLNWVVNTGERGYKKSTIFGQ